MLNFWTPHLLSKFQSLHAIWLSVHWKQKLTTTHVVQCDLGTAVEDIVTSPQMFGLRISGSLLLGVAQIFSRKVKYLLTDCSQALAVLQVSFRPELEICVEENHSMDDLSFLQDLSGEHGPVDFYTQHQSCPEEITLKEVSGATYHDESFLDAGQAQDFFGDEDSGLDRCLDFLTSVEVRGWDSEDPERTCRPDASLFPEAILDGAPKGVDGGDVAKGRPPSPVPFLPLVPDAPGAKKRGRRKCKVTTDLVTTLSDEAMRLQLGDDSDLVVEPPPLGPARRKRTASALELLTRPCSRFLPTEILEDFPKDAVPPRTEKTWRGHPRGRTPARLGLPPGLPFPSSAAGDGGLESLWDGSPDLPRSDDWRHLEEPWRVSPSGPGLSTRRAGGSSPGLSFWQESDPGQLPSGDWPSVRESGAQSLANGADSVAESSPCGPESGAESSMENEAYLPLLEFLQLGGEAELEALPLSALWSGRGREEVARTFLSLLVLCHRGAVFASQSAPYRDIFATPRPAFFTRPQQ